MPRRARHARGRKLAEESQGGVLVDEALTRDHVRVPIVGLGGSAGSITALQTIFKAVPVDSGMAFVVILHLSDEHDSTLAQVLQHATSMRVTQVNDVATVEPDCVYVIPPGRSLQAVNGELRLSDLEKERGKRTTVDIFFRTLADSHGADATAIVLSGVNSDGAIGIKRVKEHGGLTIAQDPQEAEHEGMPRSAIATGMIDWVLPAAEIAGRLLQYRDRAQRIRLLPDEGPQPAQPASVRTTGDEAALRDVLALLRVRTGRDFAYYKRSTIVRRITRRMQVNGIDDLPAYLAYLRTHPGENGALLQDLLISVTNFFRDHDCFDALEVQIDELFRNRAHDNPVRVWVPACATGEEAYSIAMLLVEKAREYEPSPPIQVFASDLDEQAIQVARNGVYPDTIATDVSEERLQRFFIRHHHGYRVRQELRETVLFAVHDLLKDSPFSRLDLVSCRNLLIYLNRDAQARALQIFHFALKLDGRLFLGTSESVDEPSRSFEVIDKKHRIYRHKATTPVLLPVPIGGSSLATSLQARDRAPFPVAPAMTGAAARDKAEPAAHAPEHAKVRATAWSELHYRLIERFGPPSLVIDRNHEVMHLSESAGRFLQISGGEPTRDLMRLVYPMLRIELRAAIHRAVQTGAPCDVVDVPVEFDGVPHRVHIHVAPADELAPGYLLVVFDAHDERKAIPSGRTSPDEPNPIARQLEIELEATKAHLRDVVDESETSTEELKAGNEELQALNEELRSATEELESSREELQSINEELTTVNQELKGKVDELDHANSDLHNLMASTAIATVFLDRNLRIARYTPAAVTLFHLIPGDVGRPLTDLTQQIDYPWIERDASRVLAELVAVEREVAEKGGRWYLARLLPYKTADDHIAGVVLTFVDITERRHAAQAGEQLSAELLRQVRRFDAIAAAAQDLIYTFDREARVTYANRLTLDLLGKPAENVNGRRLKEIGLPAAQAARLTRQVKQVISKGTPIRDEIALFGTQSTYEYILVPIVGADGEIESVASVTRDITDRKRREKDLEFLAEINADFERLSDTGDIMQAISKKASRHLGLSQLTFIEVSETGDEGLVIHSTRPRPIPLDQGWQRLDDLISPAHLATLQAGQVIAVEDVDADAETLPRHDLYRSLGIRASMSAPCASGGRWKFLLWSGRAVPAVWRPEEIALMRELGSRFCVRIERARAEEQARMLRDVLAADLDAMTRLHELSTRLVAPGSPQSLLEEVLDSVSAIQNADLSSIEMVNRKTGRLELVAARGFNVDAASHLREISADDALASRRALRERTRVVIENVETDPAYATHANIAIASGYRALQAMPLHDRNGAALGVLTTYFREPRTPTERELRITSLFAAEAAELIAFRLNEQTLRASQERLQQALRVETVAVVFSDASARLTDANDAFLQLTGFTRADLEAGHVQWARLTPDEWNERSQQALQEVRSRGRATPFEREFFRKDGSRWWGLFAAARLGSEEIIAYVIDISDSKRVREALRLSEEWMRLVVESAREYAIFSTDLELRVTSWNGGAQRLLGYSEKEIIGQDAEKVFTPEDRESGVPRTERSRALAEGRAHGERWHLRKDGSRFWSSGFLMPMRDDAGEVLGFVKILHDETESLATKQALESHREALSRSLQETERARAEAESAGRAKDQFLAVLSHELRTPLTPVLMAVQMLDRQPGITPNMRELLKMIRRNVQIETHFIDDLLDLTRISRGKLQIARDSMDLHEAIRGAVEISEADLRAKKQNLTLALDASVHTLIGDFDRIQQVVWNLLKNASKFTPSGGAIGISTHNEEDSVLIVITDTGMGIKPDLLPGIFEAFSQGGESVVRQFGGLGLGLAISKGTVDAHGGSISVESPGRNGGATTFIVRLPLS